MRVRDTGVNLGQFYEERPCWLPHFLDEHKLHLRHLPLELSCLQSELGSATRTVAGEDWNHAETCQFYFRVGRATSQTLSELQRRSFEGSKFTKDSCAFGIQCAVKRVLTTNFQPRQTNLKYSFFSLLIIVHYPQNFARPNWTIIYSENKL